MMQSSFFTSLGELIDVNDQKPTYKKPAKAQKVKIYRCQVCNKLTTSSEYGVNTRVPDLIICEPCDRSNNPYYYKEKDLNNSAE